MVILWGSCYRMVGFGWSIRVGNLFVVVENDLCLLWCYLFCWCMGVYECGERVLDGSVGLL